ncbi:MAG: radical SAM protein [Lachnospiraceae bacterium]|nr:radical SAM protein [Lachnospiraceae bacterium]
MEIRKRKGNAVDRHLSYEHCNLCPRKCGVNRSRGELGFCGQDDRIRVALTMLHHWEEPELSGEAGSGAVFFTGCTLRCVYCQNHAISYARSDKGKTYNPEELSEAFLKLQEQGALNVNLITAAMHMPHVLTALDHARSNGLHIPVVYNSSGYESPELLKELEGYIDIYLPDLKYLSADLAAAFSGAPDYPEVAMKAIDEMVRQTTTIVRHLVLPGHVKESKRVLSYLHDTYGNRVKVSIMSQYTPVLEVMNTGYPELNRRITKREYERVIDHALKIGIENAYIQDRMVAKESFIPDF